MSRRVVKRSQPFFRRQQEYLGHVNGHVEEMYGGHVIVTAFNGQEKSIETFDELNENLYHAAWKSQFFSGVMQPLMNFVSNLGYVAICVLGGFLTLNGSITVGDIQAFTQYVRNFTQPINQIANISNVLQMTAAAAERVFAFLEEDEETGRPAAFGAGGADRRLGRLCARPLRLCAGKDDHPRLFRHRQARAHQVAIVGPTGAGKTTMVKLLMRFYDVSSGAILLNGYDVKQFTRKDLRDSFGMVLQDTWLYNGTIRENIRFGRLDATDEEVLAAARAAQVDHFVRTLPHGYDTVLNEEGTNVSQGQKQLLTIARTIISNPKIMILDEATSSVDTRTEILIQKAMNKLTEGTHQLHHRPPPVHHPGCGHHPGHARRRHRGDRQPRGAAGQGRLLCRTVQQPVCRRRIRSFPGTGSPFASQGGKSVLLFCPAAAKKAGTGPCYLPRSFVQ